MCNNSIYLKGLEETSYGTAAQKYEQGKYVIKHITSDIEYDSCALSAKQKSKVTWRLMANHDLDRQHRQKRD